MQRLDLLLFLVISIYIASVESYEWTSGLSGLTWEPSYTDYTGQSPSVNVAESEPEVEKKKMPGVCPFYNEEFTAERSCWAWPPIKLEREKLPRLLELSLPFAENIVDKCNYDLCLKPQGSNGLKDLKNIQAVFVRNGDPKKKATVGPLWIQSPLKSDTINFKDLPGYYRQKNTTTNKDIVFLYFAPKLSSRTNSNEVEIQTKTLVTCGDHPERCYAVTRQLDTVSTKTVKISYEYQNEQLAFEISSATFSKGEDNLAIDITWNNPTEACQLMSVDELNRLYFIVYEASDRRRTDSLNINAEYKPVLFFKDKAVCGAATEEPTLPQNIRFSTKEHLKKLIHVLESGQLTAGNEASDNFYPEWPARKQVKVAIALCNSIPDKCTDYVMHDLTLLD